MNETILNQIEQHAKRIDLNERALVDIFNRVSKLETCVKISDANEPCTPPPPISEKTLMEHKEELFNAHSAIELLRIELKAAKTYAENWKSGWDSMKIRGDELEKERDAFKYESDNQAAAWKAIKEFIPDVNGLSLVDMVRRHVEDLKGRNSLQRENIDNLQHELDFLKANNRYQTGYSDGAGAVIKQVRDLAAKLKV